MFNLQAHTGYFPLVKLRLKIKLTNNQSANHGIAPDYFLPAIFVMWFLPTRFVISIVLCSYRIELKLSEAVLL